jgi:hypothetical protein
MSKFDDLTAQLAAKGATDPAALAAHIGRKKYGHAGLQALQAAGIAKQHAGYDTGMASRAVDPKMPPNMLEAARLVAALPVLPI